MWTIYVCRALVYVYYCNHSQLKHLVWKRIIFLQIFHMPPFINSFSTCHPLSIHCKGKYNTCKGPRACSYWSCYIFVTFLCCIYIICIVIMYNTTVNSWENPAPVTEHISHLVKVAKKKVIFNQIVIPQIFCMFDFKHTLISKVLRFINLLFKKNIFTWFILTI